MARWLKRIVLAVLALVALLIVTAVALAFLLDPNQYRDDIEALVEERTGRALDIEGDLSLSFFPWLGVEIGRVTLADAEGFHEDPFVEFDSARAAVRVWPLLQGRIETEVFAVHEPRVRLIVNEEGVGNWEDLQARLQEATDEEDNAGGTDDTGAQAPDGLPDMVADAVIGGLRIRGAAVSWNDLSTGQEAEVDPLNVDIDTVRLAEPVDLRLDARAYGPELPRTEVDLASRVEVARTLDEVTVHRVQIDVDTEGEQVPAYRQRGRLEGHGVIRAGDTLRLDWPELRVFVANMELRAALEASLGDTIEADVDWEVEPFNPKTVLGLLDLETPRTTDTEALTRLAANGSLHLRDDELELPELEAWLDRSYLTGSASVKGFEQPSITFDLELDRFNVDAYLPPDDPGRADEGEAAPAIIEEEPGLPDLEAIEFDLPLENLRELDIDGTVAVEEIRAFNLRLDELSLSPRARDGRLGFDDLSAGLYGGAIDGAFELDARGDHPFFTVDFSLDNTRFAPLLEDLLEQEPSLLDGRGAFRLAGSGGGENARELVESFDGDAELEVADGALVGMHLPYLIRSAAARIQGESVPDAPEGEDNRTVFADLSGTFFFEEGRISNDNLRINAPVLRVDGEGEIHILEESIEYLLSATVTDDLEGPGGEPLEVLRGVTVPVRIHGNLFDPSFRPELTAALTDEQLQKLRGIRDRIRDEVEELREEGTERLREGVEDLRDRFR